jgi:hypothetical protein
LLLKRTLLLADFHQTPKALQIGRRAAATRTAANTQRAAVPGTSGRLHGAAESAAQAGRISLPAWWDGRFCQITTHISGEAEQQQPTRMRQLRGRQAALDRGGTRHLALALLVRTRSNQDRVGPRCGLCFCSLWCLAAAGCWVGGRRRAMQGRGAAVCVGLIEDWDMCGGWDADGARTHGRAAAT